MEEVLSHLFKNTFAAKDAAIAYELYLEHKPDLIITDIKMPRENGIELIKRIRLHDSKTRVIIASAHTDLEYMLEATKLHLIKYIIKPMTEDKLMEALLDFIKSHTKNHIYTINHNTLYNYNQSTITTEQTIFNLTKKENEFLKMLITKNRIITYEEIENQIWDDEFIMTQNALRLFIKNIRKKLPAQSIKNIQGSGYKMILPKEVLE
ncbi:response regulator transcription factor [Arcobacter sp. 15-2]|uniref:response regulator transcription factor n=1 Tax=Arcobacter sp. 15-2 TaxID=3374109 RepID=UPI00399CAC6B